MPGTPGETDEETLRGRREPLIHTETSNFSSFQEDGGVSNVTF